jgi:hypothetical protein
MGQGLPARCNYTRWCVLRSKMVVSLASPWWPVVLIERAGEAKKTLRVTLPLGMDLQKGTWIMVDWGLIYYGADFADIFRRSASYAGRILRGAKPAELPVQAPTKVELVLNLKAAKALGLTVPPGLLIAADEVIE